jgi:hypothetical protein
VRILGELAIPGTISAVLMAAVRLVRIILTYRLRCKEIQLLREQLARVPGSQPAKAAARARRTCRRNRLL